MSQERDLLQLPELRRRESWKSQDTRGDTSVTYLATKLAVLSTIFLTSGGG